MGRLLADAVIFSILINLIVGLLEILIGYTELLWVAFILFPVLVIGFVIALPFIDRNGV